MSEIYLYDRVKKNNPTFNVWMAFPGIKSFSLSSLGYLCICKAFDVHPETNFEMISSDTQRTNIMPQNVDLMGFSMSFDLDFLTIFKMLDKYNFPLKASERDENSPLIFGGGPVLTANPEPYADFFDYIIIGDGEEVIAQTVDVCVENKDKSRKEILEKLSEIEGIYVPSLAKKNIKKITCKLDKCVHTTILSDESFFKNMFIMEISRGCSNRCGFCMASYLNLPMRFVDYDEIIKCIDFGLKHTNKIAFLGALIAAHPRFDDICDYVYQKVQNGAQIELSVSSLRVDSVSPNVVKTLVACGQKHSTIAIEAGSERLRRVINKNVTEKQIFDCVRTAKENGLKGLKIYAMIGVPTEVQADIDELLDLTKRLKKEFKGFDISYSFSSFVPKPHTPFQWTARWGTKTLEKRQNYLKKELHKLGVKANFSSIKWDFYQSLLSRGDRALGEYLLAVYKNGGAIGAFKTSYRETANLHYLPEIDFYTYREYCLEENLPWDFIEISPGKEFLKKEYKRLLNK